MISLFKKKDVSRTCYKSNVQTEDRYRLRWTGQSAHPPRWKLNLKVVSMQKAISRW